MRPDWRWHPAWLVVILVAGCGRFRFDPSGDAATVSLDTCGAVGSTPTTGLVLYWKLDETSGDVAYDSSSSGIDGAPYSHIWHPNGGVVDGAIEVPMGAGGPDGTNSTLDAIDANTTFALWFKDAGTEGTGFHNVVNKTDFSGPLVGWSLQTVADTMDMQLRIDTSAGQNQVKGRFVNALDGQWHHLAFTLDTMNAVSYLDGVEISRNPYQHGQGFGNTAVLVCATDNATAAFYDEVRYYDRALGPDEILTLVSVPCAM